MQSSLREQKECYTVPKREKPLAVMFAIEDLGCQIMELENRIDTLISRIEIVRSNEMPQPRLDKNETADSSCPMESILKGFSMKIQAIRENIDFQLSVLEI